MLKQPLRLQAGGETREGFDHIDMSQLPHRRWRIAHTEFSLGWGGQERRIMAELDGFKRRGSEVWLIAPADSKIHQRAQIAGFGTRLLAPSKIKFPLEVLSLAFWLRRHRIEILNPHSSRDSWIAGLAGRLARVPLIIRTRHFDVPIRHPWMSRQVYCRLADHVITTSPRITATLRDLFGLAEDRVSTISTGIDLERFHPTGPKATLHLPPMPAGTPLIGMIGVFRNAKGHAVLLDAAARLQTSGFKAHYLLVGEGPMVEATRQKVRDLKLESCVTFTDEREDVPEILRSLDLLVMPSLHEGIPQVGLQALACGTPMVASNVGGLPSIVRPGKTGRLVPPSSPEALAVAIRHVFDEPLITRSLAEQGRQLTEREHSLEQMLDRLQILYERHLPAARKNSS